MKKTILIALCFTISISSCKKEEEESINNESTNLEELLLAGENTATWRSIFMTAQHREGYIVNGIKTYEFISDTTDTITSLDHMTFLFYNEGDSVSLLEPPEEDHWTSLHAGLFLEGGSIIYQITNNNKIEFFGPYLGYPFEHQIYMQWDITSSNSNSIRAIYDDFWPGDNTGATDTIPFSCDQGEIILEKIN